MKPWKRVAIVLGVVGLFYALMHILLLVQSIQALHWIAKVARFVLYCLGFPAQLFCNWTKIRLGIATPLFLWDCLLVSVYWVCGSMAYRMFLALTSTPEKGRRALFAGTAAVALGVAGLRHAYGEVTVLKKSLSLKDLPESLSGLKLALVADLHRGPVISQEYLEGVVEKINALEPDIVLLPGDFVSKSDSYFEDVTAVLSQLKPKIASLATLGNHDHWEGVDAATAAVENAGVTLLTNSSVHLNPDRTISESGQSGLCFAGVDDLWCGKPDLQAALADVADNVPRLLMSHNPDFAEQKRALKADLRVDFQVSGHTHGGQVVLPGIGAMTSGSYHGLKYIYGDVQGPQWPVFITRGVGTSIIPIRVGAAPEIVLFTLQA